MLVRPCCSFPVNVCSVDSLFRPLSAETVGSSVLKLSCDLVTVLSYVPTPNRLSVFLCSQVSDIRPLSPSEGISLTYL
jgi:hypothetical protein